MHGLKDAVVMGEFVYNALDNYFHALELKGYQKWEDVEKLLILLFYKDFVYNDYRGLISKEDYQVIEKALDCLYGTSCLIPYPECMITNKLYIGSTSELAQRIKTLETTWVLKMEDSDNDSDVMLVEERP